METRDKMSIRGEVKWIKSRDGIYVSESPWMQNQVLATDDLGASIILDRMVGKNVYSLNVTHADIGTGSTAALTSDTGLENGLIRASIGATSRSGLTAKFRFFYPNAVTPNTVYNEFGMAIDGNASLGSGRFFNRLVFSIPLVKSSGEDHTIVCQVTITV